jgi:hypothetical protein
VVVELKKYDTIHYLPKLLESHFKQLALTALLFTRTYQSVLTNPPLALVLRVHKNGPTMYWLDENCLRWGQCFLQERAEQLQRKKKHTHTHTQNKKKNKNK